MRTAPARQRIHILCLAVLMLCGLSSVGCINLAANLIHAIRGNDRPAEYKGLEGKRVAVVVGTDSGLGSDAVSSALTSHIQALLNMKIKKIDVVSKHEVENWFDANGWNDSDYVAIGKGVNADNVLAVDVLNLTLQNGATLYRGQCDITVSVYDIKEDGKILYRKQIPEFAFPSLGGMAITDTSESKFRARYLELVAATVGGLFYGVDPTLDVALDATSTRF